jgi:CheY-like chemotaxis protein
MFERFRQAESGTTRQHAGLGLGLAIVRNLVEMHGGTIHALSEGAGKGATFRVRLPLRIVHDELQESTHAHPRPERPASPVPAAMLDGARVLAVDDDPDSLRLLKDVLEAAGARVTTANSVSAAIDTIHADRPDVLVADIGMPVTDGYELVKHLRQSDDAALRDLPAAALTAYARSEDRAKARNSGFGMYLSKPIDPAELVAAIGALAKRHHDAT